MSWFIECPFCHKSVFRWLYAWHESGHTARRSDGQMNEHTTLAPDQRFDGSLAGVPQAYRHAKCGAVTGMPEEIIRTYLVNPLSYNDSTFCCGCGDYIISSELVWVVTNESVMSYMGKLRCDFLRTKFGIDPTATDIVVTPRGARALQRIAGEQEVKPPFFVSLWFDWTGSQVTYDIRFAEGFDPRVEEVIVSSGIDVVVRKAQRQTLKGTVIDFNESGAAGIMIARLFAWC